MFLHFVHVLCTMAHGIYFYLVRGRCNRLPWRVKYKRLTTKIASCTAEEKLQIFRTQLIHRHLVVVDGALDHVRFLFLKQNNTRLDRVFNAETGNHTRPSLANSMASICALPFGRWIPPSIVYSR